MRAYVQRDGNSAAPGPRNDHAVVPQRPPHEIARLGNLGLMAEKHPYPREYALDLLRIYCVVTENAHRDFARVLTNQIVWEILLHLLCQASRISVEKWVSRSGSPSVTR